MALQHLRSNTASKRPTPASMADGQLAINTNATSPGVFFKDAGGALIKVGPVHVGTSAPNSSPAAGGSTGNSVGEQWLDTSGGSYVFKVWDGSAWRSEAGEFVDAAGDTMTGDLVMNNADIVFEGSSEDDFETTLTVTNPTADRTITLPDTTGTVVTTGDTGSVTSTMITDGTIVNADINASAAIALSKLATGALPTAITVASANIVDGTIVNADVNAAAAIAGTKIDPDFGSQTIETTGVINAGSGTEGAPSVSVGTTDNGIYSPGTDQVAVATNGTGRLVIDSSGNIQTNGAVDRSSFLTVGGHTFGRSLIFDTGSGNDVQILNYRSTSIVFGNSGTEQVRITNAGLVGIGTSGPSEQLHIANADDAVVLIESTGTNSTDDARLEIKTTNGLFAIQNDRSLGTSGVLTFAGNTADNLCIDHDTGRVGIGTASPAYPLSIFNNSVSPWINISDGTTTAFVGVNTGLSGFQIQSTSLTSFYNNGSERARIDSSGRLLVGTSSSPSAGAGQYAKLFSAGNTLSATGDGRLALARGNTAANLSSGNGIGELLYTDSTGGTFASIGANVDAAPGTNDYPGRLVFSTTADGASSPTEAMRITQSGELQMLRTVSTNYIKTGNTIRTANGNNTLISYFHGYYTPRMVAAINCNTTSNAPNLWGAGSLVFYTGTSGNNDANNNLAARMTISYTGAVSIVGSLSKGSGSFKINHPLPQKAETHHLVHSFIEGPQADLIYRGHVQLVGGRAIVNIDEAGRMSEGTFEALCTNVCCFTSNESDWTAVRGSVSGNILTIEAQDEACTAEVCWMVVGERKDPHMLETEWTDENGRVITEPLKASEETEPSQA